MAAIAAAIPIPTIPGVFSVPARRDRSCLPPISKAVRRVPRRIHNAPMPFAQFVTDYGVALHAGHNPGHPASHGCVRLPNAFAKKLFAVTDLGTPVLIGA